MRDVYVKNVQLQESNDAKDEELEVIHSKQERQNYNRDKGRALKNLNDAIDKIDAHIAYTKDHKKNYNEEIIDHLTYYVTTLRSRHPELQTPSKIAESRDLLEKTYKAMKPSLSRISPKKLKELVEERKETGLKP